MEESQLYHHLKSRLAEILERFIPSVFFLYSIPHKYKLTHTFETHARTQIIRCLSFSFFQTPEQKLKYIYFISTQDDERQLEYGELNHGERREEK